MTAPLGARYDSPGPVGEAVVICTTAAPAADVTLSPPSRRIFIGGGGNLAVTMAYGTASIVVSTVPTGSFLDIQVKAIHSTGTTATGIVAFW